MLTRNSKRNLAILIFAAMLIFYATARYMPGSEKSFVPHALPVSEVHRLFDVGIVDANGDDHFDIYTSNHHFRQVLLMADGKGGYSNVLSKWGLDQSRDFPMAELSYDSPKPERPGIYVYWRGTNLVILAHGSAQLGQWRGSLHTFDPVTILKNDGEEIERRENSLGPVTETTLKFSLKVDGKIILQPGGQGLPIEFSFAGALKPEQVLVGLGKVSPASTNFTLAMQDRHAHAWADFNGDGVMDVFINRGALSGTLRAHTAEVQRGIKDELFLSRAPGEFIESASALRIEKNGCSGRHAKWVDFNGDGLLDLFVNCYDRENVSGDFPKQLYRQGPGRTLSEVAESAALGLPDQQMGQLVWMDADADGDVDLLAYQDDGLFLYREQHGRFVQERVTKWDVADAPQIGETAGSYWLYDGKLTVTDFDADGDLDVFLASKRGSLLLKNQAGKFTMIDPAGIGLPARSGTGQWVDYDNDGFPDLHLFPQGLYRQGEHGRFESTGLFSYPADQYQAAIINWFDLDNDGRLDVLLALDENPTYKRWWQFNKKPGQKGLWKLAAYHNVARGPNHWLQLKLAGDSGNSAGIGARVSVTTAGRTQTQEVGSSEGAFFSQGHYRLYFGLGPQRTVETVTVRWPDGTQQQLHDVKADQLLTVVRGPVEQHALSGEIEARR